MNVASNSSDSDINISQLISIVLDGKWWILASAVIFMIFSFIYVQLATPIYSGNALIQVEKKSAGIPGLSDMGDIFSQEGSSTTEIEILKTRSIIGQTVDDFKLYIHVTPKFFPLIGKYFYRNFKGKGVARPLWGLFNSYAWGGERISIVSLDVPDHLIGKKLILTAGENGTYKLHYDGALLLEGKAGGQLTVSNKQATTIVSDLDLKQDENPDLEPGGVARSADGKISLIAAGMKARPGSQFILVRSNRYLTLNDLQKKLSISELGKKTGILNLSMKHPDPKYIVKILDSIVASYIQQNVERVSEQAGKSLNFVTERLPVVKKELADSEEELNKYMLKRGSADVTLETKALLNQVVDVDAKIYELKLIEADLKRKYTKTHPVYISFLKKKEDLALLRDRLNRKIESLPETQKDVLRLMRSIETKQKIYLNMLKQSQELRIIKAGAVGNVRSLDLAEASPIPVSPKKFVTIVVAAILGLFFGIVLVFIKNYFYHCIESIADLEALDLQVLASVPECAAIADSSNNILELRAENGTSLVASLYPEDLSIEALRSLRTSLHFALMDAKNNIFMISGPTPNIGKSFISTNLSALLAESGKKIILLDADLRRGDTAEVLHVEKSPGLSELISGQTALKDVVNIISENFHYIPRGAIPPNPSELLMGEKFNENLQILSKHYDFVIIDTPPILAVTDAAVIGRLAGASFLVVRYGVVHSSELEACLKRFKSAGVEINGVVFNGIKKKAGIGNRDYGYYKQYAYDSV